LKELKINFSFSNILLVAFVVRLLAAIFSKGYVAHDDHFIPVETAYLWLSKQADFFSDKGGAWRSPLYTLIHYFLFAFLDKISITGAQTQMFIVRLLHGIYSLLTVFYGYLFAKQISNEKTALFVASLLSIFWIFPYISVHSLVESACVPPLVMAFYYTLLADEKKRKIFWFVAAFCFASAFTIRFQTFSIGAVFGLCLLFQKKFKEALLLLAFTFFFLLIIMGIPDTIAFGYPFASFIQYSLYNLTATSVGVSNPWYFYILLLLLIFLFPSSLLFFFGMKKLQRKYYIYLISSLSFVIFHSIFSNKQERFIIPAAFLFLILGAIGWSYYVQNKKFGFYKKKVLKILWIWFWFWNICLLFIATPTYTKKTLIKAISYLSEKNDLQAILVESPADNFYFPKFYLQKSADVYTITANTPLQEKTRLLQNDEINYFIFLGEKPSQEKLAQIEELQNAKLQEQKNFSYNTIENFLWGRSIGNSELKIVSIYKKSSFK
jgi:4-amino-4-deoxy-L-arabinose transferase-like glycosyltransferase